MSAGPVISVIMLTYNREALLPRAIESILCQTFTSYEFIIVNNGATDQSGAVAEAYVRKDARVRVLHREKGNIGSGRNAGLDVACGEYIAFIDDDDWAEPDFLEFLHDLATENAADIAICGSANKAYDEKRVMTAEEALITLMWRKHYNVQFPTKLLRRSLFLENRFSTHSKYDDIELMPRILASAGRIAYHGLPKYTFYRHPGNNSAWTTDHNLLNAETLDEYLHVYRKRTEWLCRIFPKNEEVWHYFEYSFMISMVEKIDRLQLTDCAPQAESMCTKLQACKSEFLTCRNILDFEKEWMEKYIAT